MRKILALVFILLFFYQQSRSQQTGNDSAAFKKEISTVIISATRTEQDAEKLPVPVKIISAEEIKSSGYIRLTDVFAGIAGTSVVDNFGRGLQLRGFDPAYTLILVNNEPVIGRNGGTFDLDKISLDNVERIEIVKGPSSALYGSEALAGVVNIITKKPQQGLSASSDISFGSNNTTNISGNIDAGNAHVSSQTFVNGYYTSGYDLDKATLYNSGSKNRNGTLEEKINYRVNNKIFISLNARHYEEEITNRDRFMVNDIYHNFDMIDHTKDFSLTPGAKFYFSNKTFLSFNHHFAYYNYHSQINYADGGGLYYDDAFKQVYNKPELLLSHQLTKSFLLTAGAGYVGENISTTRYSNDKFQSTLFSFAQLQISFLKKCVAIVGARADHSTVYGMHYSPKFSAQYSPNEKIKFLASWGTGFKSPDFRQLYLNFTNSVIGYSVFGSEEINSQLQILSESGQLQSIFSVANTLGKLKPESSQAFDAGITIKPFKQFSFSLNVFRNDINDLIETKAVAQKTNGQFVYSYLNLDKVFTQGIEAEAEYKLKNNFSIRAGYQFLDAEDKQVIQDIKNGKIYGRNPQTLFSYQLKLEDYGGLFNRSKHSGNFKIQYTNIKYKFKTSTWFTYKGKYGLADKNGNLILDSSDEYVKGYGTFNFSVTKEISTLISTQFSAQNIFNYTDVKYIPSMPGATYMSTLRLNIIQNKNQQQNKNKK